MDTRKRAKPASSGRRREGKQAVRGRAMERCSKDRSPAAMGRNPQSVRIDSGSKHAMGMSMAILIA